MAKKASTKKNAPTPVDSIRHQDKRMNIPTEELRDFVTDEEHAPKTMLYPRDPSLDPQLVWKGKDDQDRADLAVPVVPIYIQEKIHPQAIIDDFQRWSTDCAEERRSEETNLRTSASSADKPSLSSANQLSLFADFNGLPEEFDQRIDFYQHDAHWSNRFILGDSLLVMTSLAEKEGLKGKVQTIYIDPPYGIRFGSNWQVSTRKRDVKDGKAEDATRQPEQVRAFRDTWQLGIHSYLAYLRDRLVAARELLTETGSVFVQIGDENVHLVRSVLDEVFGSENFCAQINYRSMTALGQDGMASVYDYILWYAKNPTNKKFRPLYAERPITEEAEFCFFAEEGSDYRKLTREEVSLLAMNDVHHVFKRSELRSSGFTPSCTYSFKLDGTSYTPSAGKSWRTHEDGMKKLIQANRLVVLGRNPYFRQYYDDFPVMQIENSWHDTAAGFSDTKIYVVQTADRLIQRCLLMTTDPGDLVLNPTCGSGTTAYVAEQWGRRWITCDTSRVALALARTRLMAAKFPYYYLADDYPQISQMAAEEDIKKHLRKSAPSADKSSPDIRRGFVYKRVPHVTLKSIANNPDIKEGMSRKEIDAAIARHADSETLFDQPYADNKRVRVSGPFTVESLSPHRTISVEEKRQRSEHWNHGRSLKIIGPDDFATMIIDNLRKAGVQNTVKGERLKFDSLNPYAGEWIHAEGFYTELSPQMDADENTNNKNHLRKSAKSADKPSADKSSAEPVVRRAAICIGPEHGTVGAQLVKEAAKEAVKGVGFDLLIVCGFAFDPSVSEEAKRYGKLTVLAARMNPDLAMGDELLKKTGAGNLFMVFGEPDIEIRRVDPQMTRMSADKSNSKKHLRTSAKSADKSSEASADELLVVEIRGLDVYDPTTGEIRSSSTDDIACWFIDTAYNGESFFVRHAYFTGADEPYDKLRRALKADIDESAWSSLYSTTSRPFDRPETGKIAVKVINHYGDEILKVYDV